jgi:hypothetical protein
MKRFDQRYSTASRFKKSSVPGKLSAGKPTTAMGRM